MGDRISQRSRLPACPLTCRRGLGGVRRPAGVAPRVRVLGSGRSQKNDRNDARSVAIAALRSDRLALVGEDSHSRILRLLVKRHRDNTQLRATHCVRLHALLLEFEAGGIGSTITAAKANRLLSNVAGTDEITQCQLLIARELIDDIAALDESLASSKKRISAAVAASGTSLCGIYGVGPIGAAQIIGYVGDICRFETKAQFATYNGTAPTEVSSGGRSRHRLNLRRLNILNTGSSDKSLPGPNNQR